MSKGIQIIKENNNLAEWSRQVEECRNSGLSVRSWCEQHQIAISTFHYRQQRVWKALQKSSQFVEVPLSFDESIHSNIAASVRVGNICAEVHNGADEATLAALFRVLKSC
ncbi:MAG: IS66 family insertion sequence element accessory protein TnpB [Ruminococcus sp.]|uniref:IS66 family insertion sequence element accessory protein TnpA n=1 Tax=Ruminococcus sp. TaxID=41978 RepID=UPI002873E828|nr:IS66 family insertion sequence element accessory protein TnpB [Ruminococcus sp.]MBQ3285185.1 IS66 family insertion sequence element accessory protein TnpB [Ruminococcus sp.]